MYKNITKDMLETIPYKNEEEAYLIVKQYINENSPIEDVLRYTHFLPVEGMNWIIEKAYAQNADISILINAITPYSEKILNEKIVYRALEENIDIGIVLRNAPPFVGTDVVDMIIRKAIECDYELETIVKGTLRYASHTVIDEISIYAINKKAKINVIDYIYPYASYNTKKDLDSYRESLFNNQQSKENRIDKTDIYETVKNIFLESGISFDEVNTDDQLEIDSLHSISIICELEDAFDILIPEEYFAENKLTCFSDYVDMIYCLLKEDNQ